MVHSRGRKNKIDPLGPQNKIDPHGKLPGSQTPQKPCDKSSRKSSKPCDKSSRKFSKSPVTQVVTNLRKPCDPLVL